MPKIHGASARHPLLSSFEPEAVDALALVALRLIDAIRHGSIARADQTDQTTTGLIDAGYRVLDAARGDSALIQAAVDSLLAAGGSRQSAGSRKPYHVRVIGDAAAQLKICSEAFGQLSALFASITRDPGFSGMDAQRLAGAGRSIADDFEDRALSACEDLRTGGNP
jgi:hypothetical protein